MRGVGWEVVGDREIECVSLFLSGSVLYDTIAMALWWAGGAFLTSDFGLSHGTYFGQWDACRRDVREN